MLHVSIQHVVTDTIVRCRGRIVLGADFRSLQLVDKVARRNVVINLNKIKSLDAYGIGQLLELRHRLVSSGKNIVLCQPQPRIFAILRLTGMLKVFPVECSGNINSIANNERLSFGCASKQAAQAVIRIRCSWNLLVRRQGHIALAPHSHLS
jgi:anti-anti-sigma factor